MSQAKKKRTPERKKSGDTTLNQPLARKAKPRSDDDSEQIERAVYDGMQDLRAPKKDER